MKEIRFSRPYPPTPFSIPLASVPERKGEFQRPVQPSKRLMVYTSRRYSLVKTVKALGTIDSKSRATRSSRFFSVFRFSIHDLVKGYYPSTLRGYCLVSRLSASQAPPFGLGPGAASFEFKRGSQTPARGYLNVLSGAINSAA